MLRHWESSVEMRDVLATTRRSERHRSSVAAWVRLRPEPIVDLSRRLVRHPAALCRLIDAERAVQTYHSDPLDTVYTYEDPDASPYEVLPDQWQRRRYE